MKKRNLDWLDLVVPPPRKPRRGMIPYSTNEQVEAGPLTYEQVVRQGKLMRDGPPEFVVPPSGHIVWLSRWQRFRRWLKKWSRR